MASYPQIERESVSHDENGIDLEASASVDSHISNNSDGSDTGIKKRKMRKKKVEKACIYCRRSHMICDDSRPCLRCIKRGIGHLCHDEPTPGRQKRAPEMDSETSQTPESLVPDPTTKPQPNNSGPLSEYVAGIVPTLPKEFSIANKNEMLTPPLPDLRLQSKQPQSSYQSQSEQQKQQQPQQQQLSQPQQSERQPEIPESEQPPGLVFENKLNPQQSIAGIKSLNSVSNILQLNQEPFFYSKHTDSEFSSLNDFLSMIDHPELVNGALQDSTSLPDPLMGFLMIPEQMNSITNLTNLQLPSPTTKTQASAVPESQPKSFRVKSENGGRSGSIGGSWSYKETHQPVISDSARDKFFLTAADPTTEVSPEERLKQVIKAKLEAGLLQPYNYAKGYARLQSYMDNYMNQSSRQRIMKPLLIFRPEFRAIARTLKDVDLVLVEENFERVLLDYDRVFTSLAIPACLWRRTGEIYRGNKEFASLVGVTTDDLKDGKLAIYELMSEESAVNFWEKYGAIAFDKGQQAVLTSCNLRTKDGFKRKSCCFSFTIRRDRYNIPSCIVGNFIPIDS